MVFVIGDLMCTVIVLVGLIVFTFLLLVPKVVELRRGLNGSRRVLVVLMVAAMVFLGSYVAWLYLDYQEWTDTKTLDLGLNVTAPEGAEGTVWVPITVNRDLRDAISVREGTADLTIVETKYGTALRVDFKGSVSIRGGLETRGEFDDFELTSVDTSHVPGTRWYWFGRAGDPNDTVEVDLSLEYHSVYRDEWYYATHQLDPGWASLRVRWGYQDWYYG